MVFVHDLKFLSLLILSKISLKDAEKPVQNMDKLEIDSIFEIHRAH